MEKHNASGLLPGVTKLKKKFTQKEYMTKLFFVTNS